jgi:hypothetical protein
MTGWISLSRIIWVMMNKMKLKNPNLAYLKIHPNYTGKVVDSDGKTIMDFNTEEELDKKLNFLQKGGSINDIGPGANVPTIKKEKAENNRTRSLRSDSADSGGLFN